MEASRASQTAKLANNDLTQSLMGLEPWNWAVGSQPEEETRSQNIQFVEGILSAEDKNTWPGLQRIAFVVEGSHKEGLP